MLPLVSGINSRLPSVNHALISPVLTHPVSFGLHTHARTHARHLDWMNMRKFCLQKGGSQEHISLITIMFCFNEFAFTF